MAYRILIVDDENELQNMVKDILTQAGYETDAALSCAQAMDRFQAGNPDAVLLDINLPDGDGFSLFRQFRKSRDVPILFLSARDEDADRRPGAWPWERDDYITKPFELAELTARVEAVLRRYGKSRDKIAVAGIEVDMESKTVEKDGRPVELTAKEYDLLLLFLRNRNIALYRERIYEEVWGGEFDPDSRTVDIHVQRLKRKMGLEHSIVSVRNVGYRLEVSET